MNNRMLSTVRAFNMLSEGDRVIVALSGGADSVTLLHVLLKLREVLDLTVYAAHVNHQLRGQESQRDEDFVRALCADLGVELFVKSVDVNALAKEKSEGFELAGRQVRYEFFGELADKYNALIATAHTASDSAETALLNMARGTSLTGLCSIPFVRGRIIRPLLNLTRTDIEAYVRDNNLSFVDDSTNFDAEICNRNKVRHEIVPVLKEVNSGFEQNFIRLRDQLLQVDGYMRAQSELLLDTARTEYGYDTNVLNDAHPALKSYAIKLILEQAGASAEQKHIELIESFLSSRGAVDLCGGYTALIKQGVFRIVKNSDKRHVSLLLTADSDFSFNGKKYSVKELTESEIVHKKLATFCIGCDKISLDTLIRTRCQGDRFTLLNRGITKDLRKLQNELKIPSEQRDTVMLIANGNTVLWAEGAGVSAQGKYQGGKGIFVEITEE